MTMWEYNAIREGYEYRNKDELVLLLQAAYYNAHWSGFSKHKKSLDKVIKSIYKNENQEKKEKIDVEKISKEFERMEELITNGYYSEQN